MRTNLFGAADPCNTLSTKIEDLSAPVSDEPSLADLDQYLDPKTQKEIGSVVLEYQKLQTRTNILPKNLAEVRSALLNLLHSETLSALKVYQLPHVGQAAYNLGEKTKEEHNKNMWSNPIG